MILRSLKERAARQLGEEVSRAVITVPAFFSEQQREATREAGQLAGLDVVRIINEPTAASLTYHASEEKCERLLVYDLGGGTFDVSIVQIEQGVVEVLASHGDTNLGGDDFDQLLLDHVCDRFREEHDVDLRDSLSSKARVLRAVEEAKKRLSVEPYTTIAEEFIAEKAGVSLHLQLEISRAQYEELIEPLLNKTLVCVDEALSDSNLTAPEIDRVVLVGGASRTPLVHRLLTEQLGQPVHAEIDPDLCVSMGAAIQGGLIAGLDLGPALVDITPHTLGVRCVGNLHGVRSDNVFARLINRNTALPAVRSDVFRTMFDSQEVVQVSVFQGENDDIRYNESVGEFDLDGLADVAAGNEILVRFEQDLDGILKVTAVEKATGLTKAITIENTISRFRETERAQAQARIDDAFDAQPTLPADEPQLAVFEPETHQSPELSQAGSKAKPLLDKSRQLAAEANEVDAQEMKQLADQLMGAIESEDLAKITELTTALDDLVFYLQDV